MGVMKGGPRGTAVGQVTRWIERPQPALPFFLELVVLAGAPQ